METRKKKSFKRLFAFLMAFVMVTTLAASAIFAAEPTFKDVPADYEFYDEIEDLAAKDIIGGYGTTGLFKPEEKLTRAQAAKMIAKAADIEVSKDFETSFTDIDEDVDMYEHIWALEEAKIVKGWGTTNEFRPDEAIERGHVAKMVALAFGLADGSVDVEFKDLPKDEEVADAIMALATNDIVKGYGTSGEFRPEEPVLRGQFSKMVSRAMNLELEIVEAKAVSPTVVELTLNKKLAKLARTDVVITNVKTSDRQYVKTVELEDEVAEVELFDALVTKSTYNAKIGKAEKEFEYVVGTKRNVVASSPQIVPAGVATPIKFEILDENGLDVTDITKVIYESNVDLDSEDKITLANGAQAFVYVVAVDAQAKELARSGRILVKGETRKAAKLLAYSLGEDTPAFASSTFKAVHSLREDKEGMLLYAYVEDQFGTKSVVNATFESLNKSVALVDQSNGSVTPLKAGAFAVRIKAGSINEVVALEVEAEAKVAGLELDESAIGLSDKIPAGESVEVTVIDQYGKPFKVEAAGEITAKVLSGTDLVDIAAKVNIAAGDDSVVFVVKPEDGKEGVAVIEFTYKPALVAFTTKLTVTVSKAGDLDDYIVEGAKAKLDKNGNDTDATKLPKTMTLEVFGVDANGVKIGPALLATDYTLKLYQGTTTIDLDHSATFNAGLDELVKDKTYTVEVYVGTLKVDVISFDVVDTTAAPDEAEVEQIGSKLDLVLGKSISTADLEDLFAIAAGSTTINLDGQFVAISDNAAVVSNAGKALKLGNATLVFKSFNSTEIEADDLRVDVTVVAPTAVKDKTVIESDKQDALEAAHKDLVVTQVGTKITITGKAASGSTALDEWFGLENGPDSYIGLKFDFAAGDWKLWKPDWAEDVDFSDGKLILGLIKGQNTTTLNVKYGGETITYTIDYTAVTFPEAE